MNTLAHFKFISQLSKLDVSEIEIHSSFSLITDGDYSRSHLTEYSDYSNANMITGITQEVDDVQTVPGKI